MGNKGFSLVELIVVIAIMAVLVGVLAPQFIKYVEKSKKSTDIQNAQEILSTLQVAITDEDYTVDGATVAFTKDGIIVTEGTETNVETALSDAGISVSTTKIKSSDYSTAGITFTISTSAVYGDDGDLSAALGLSSSAAGDESEAEPAPEE
jgi:type IV pilus assembly protein PilA